MLGVGCFPSVHGFNSRHFRGILSHDPFGTSNIEHPTPNRQSMAQLETIGCSMLDVGCWMFSVGSWVQCATFSGNSVERSVGKVENPTSNTQPPSNGPIGNHWLFDVGCWVLDVFRRFMGSIRDIFGEFSPMIPSELRISNIQHPTANQWPNWKPLVVRCWMLGVGCFPSVHGFNARIFRGILSPLLRRGERKKSWLRNFFAGCERFRLLQCKGRESWRRGTPRRIFLCGLCENL